MRQRSRAFSAIWILIITVFLALNIKDLVNLVSLNNISNMYVILGIISISLGILFEIALIIEEFLSLTSKLKFKHYIMFMILFFIVVTLSVIIKLVGIGYIIANPIMFANPTGAIVNDFISIALSIVLMTLIIVTNKGLINAIIQYYKAKKINKKLSRKDSDDSVDKNDFIN